MTGDEHDVKPMRTLVGSDEAPKLLPIMVTREPGVYGGPDIELNSGGLYENIVDAEPTWPPTVAITGRATADPALYALNVHRNEVKESQSELKHAL
jgi:hypothetical protein